MEDKIAEHLKFQQPSKINFQKFVQYKNSTSTYFREIWVVVEQLQYAAHCTVAEFEMILNNKNVIEIIKKLSTSPRLVELNKIQCVIFQKHSV